MISHLAHRPLWRVTALALFFGVILYSAACNPLPQPRTPIAATPTAAAATLPTEPAPRLTPADELRPINAPAAATATSSPTATPTEATDFLPRRMLRTGSVALPTETPAPTATRRPVIPTATRPTNVRELHVPILMYHYISTPPADADAIRLDLSVSPERFAEELAYFAAQGYQSVSLQTLYDAVSLGKPLPPKPIVFTFDDGYADAYANAMPILRRYNFTGTFYIVTGFVGRKGYVTREQVAEMAEAGMDMQSHTVSHIPMKGKTAEVLRAEMLNSKRALEQMTGKPVNFFCYPSGQFDALAIDMLKETGYLSATTTKPGAWQNQALPYEWPRIRARGKDQVPDLVKRVTYPD